MLEEVDFPSFVTGLIEGIFQSIVQASIQQMHAYGRLVPAKADLTGEVEINF